MHVDTRSSMQLIFAKGRHYVDYTREELVACRLSRADSSAHNLSLDRAARQKEDQYEKPPRQTACK